jgi:ApbE superfamily uncharacterized protein (UPF0280 family)
MTAGPQISWLPDGRRLHMNHGPIDLIVEVWGNPAEVALAYGQAADRFATILPELVAELRDLRKPALFGPPPPHTPPRKGEGGSLTSAPPSPLRGGVWGGGGSTRTGIDPSRTAFFSPTARRMHAAVMPFSADTFITPMAAVAGAVADEMLFAMVSGRRLDRAYVNDGGDIALHVAPGETLTLAIAGTGNGLDDRLSVHHDQPVRGIATSGWRGRSFSLGIADAVTVLARDAATADAAATLIANAVDLPGHPAIARAPAVSLQPDTDLGERLVTTGVGALAPAEIARALAGGLAVADAFLARGQIEGAALFLGGHQAVAGAALPLHSIHPSIIPPDARPPSHA